MKISASLHHAIVFAINDDENTRLNLLLTERVLAVAEF